MNTFGEICRADAYGEYPKTLMSVFLSRIRSNDYFGGPEVGYPVRLANLVAGRRYNKALR